jgi:hypothetical protein
MLGFFGAKPRYLAKYANFVRKIDIPTGSLSAAPADVVHSDVHTYQPSMMNLASARLATRSAADIAAIVKNEWADPFRTAKQAGLAQKPAPLMFYLLSNNGAFNFSFFLNHLKETNSADFDLIQEHTNGIVFDSCPSDPSPALMSRGCTSVATALAFKKPQSSHPLFSPVIDPLVNFTYPLNADQWAMLRASLHANIPKSAAGLYLLSDADDLVYAEESKAHAAEQAVLLNAAYAARTSSTSALAPVLSARAAAALGSVTQRLGERVFLEDFKDSSHMDHMRKYPQRYSDLVGGFYEYATRT